MNELMLLYTVGLILGGIIVFLGFRIMDEYTDFSMGILYCIISILFILLGFGLSMAFLGWWV